MGTWERGAERSFGDRWDAPHLGRGRVLGGGTPISRGVTPSKGEEGGVWGSRTGLPDGKTH